MVYCQQSTLGCIGERVGSEIRFLRMEKGALGCQGVWVAVLGSVHLCVVQGKSALACLEGNCS